MRRKHKKLCTSETIGVITGVKNENSCTSITVRYLVGMHSYYISELLKYNSEPIKVGFITVGQKKTPKIGEGVLLNRSVKVMYNPNNPMEAYLKDNVGMFNI